MHWVGVCMCFLVFDLVSTIGLSEFNGLLALRVGIHFWLPAWLSHTPWTLKGVHGNQAGSQKWLSTPNGSKQPNSDSPVLESKSDTRTHICVCVCVYCNEIIEQLLYICHKLQLVTHLRSHMKNKKNELVYTWKKNNNKLFLFMSDCQSVWSMIMSVNLCQIYIYIHMVNDYICQSIYVKYIFLYM